MSSWNVKGLRMPCKDSPGFINVGNISSILYIYVHFQLTLLNPGK